MGAWGGFQNGKIPADARVSVGNGCTAHPAAAYQWSRLVAGCRAATGVTLGVTEWYRPLGSISDQYITVASRTSTGGSNQWYQYGRWRRGLTPSAAYPGTSEHGWALAGDITNYARPDVWAYLKAHAAFYGFAVNTIAGEPWHIVYTGSLKVRPPEQENDMLDYRLMRTQGNPALWASTNGIVVHRNLTSTTKDLEVAGRDVQTIDPKTEANEAKILASWEAEAKENLSAIGNAVASKLGGMVPPIDVSALAAALGPFIASDADLAKVQAAIIDAIPKSFVASAD